MINGLYGTIDKMPHVIFDGIAYAALKPYGKTKGCSVIAVTGNGSPIDEVAVKNAFVRKNGGRFIGSRWYR